MGKYVIGRPCLIGINLCCIIEDQKDVRYKTAYHTNTKKIVSFADFILALKVFFKVEPANDGQYAPSCKMRYDSWHLSQLQDRFMLAPHIVPVLYLTSVFTAFLLAKSKRPLLFPNKIRFFSLFRRLFSKKNTEMLIYSLNYMFIQDVAICSTCISGRKGAYPAGML